MVVPLGMMGATEAVEVDIPADVAAADRRLRESVLTLRAALMRQREVAGEALAGYGREVDSSLRRLQAELDVATAKLKAEQAESAPELREALESLQRTFRGAVDELRIRARLGRMELRDEADHLGARLGHAVEEVRRYPAGSFEELRSRVVDVIGEVRSGLRRLDPFEDHEEEKATTA